MERYFDDEFDEIANRLEVAEKRAEKAEARLNAMEEAVPMAMSLEDISYFWDLVEKFLKNPRPPVIPIWTEISDDDELDDLESTT